MNKLNLLLTIARYDLLMRLRSVRFWLTLALCACAIWYFFPAQDAPYLTVGINAQYRPRYSSAWIGMMIAALDSILLSLVGFYLVRGTLLRDFESRVWQLLVGTTMTRRGYLLAKWMSQFVVLLCLVAISVIIGLVAQWVRAEDRHLNLIQMLIPVISLSLPALAISSTCAIWFDMIPFLRKTTGNVLFFIAWIFALASTSPGVPTQLRAHGIADPLGMTVFSDSLQANAALELPVKHNKGFCLVCGRPHQHTQIYNWNGSPPSLELIGTRMFWLLAALGGVLAATPLLDWSAAKSGEGLDRVKKSKARRLFWLSYILRPLEFSTTGRILSFELSETMRRRPWWWWLALITSLGVQTFAPIEGASMALIIAWVLNLDVLSRLVLREKEYGTHDLIYSCAGAARRMLPARWWMLVLLVWMMTLPFTVHMAMINPPAAIACLVVGVSVATWAMATSALTQHAKVFEVAACLIAYAALSGAPILNLKVSAMETAIQHLQALPIAVALLLMAAYFARRGTVMSVRQLWPARKKPVREFVKT